MSQSTTLPQVATSGAGQAQPADAGDATAQLQQPPALTDPSQTGFLPTLGNRQSPSSGVTKKDKAAARRELRKSGEIQEFLASKKHPYAEIQGCEVYLNRYYCKKYDERVTKYSKLGGDSVYGIDEDDFVGVRDPHRALVQGSYDIPKDGNLSHDASQKPLHPGGEHSSMAATQPGSGSRVQKIGRSLDQAFHEATSIAKSGRFTLYSTVITNNQQYLKYEKKLGVTRRMSSIFGGGFSTDNAEYLAGHQQRHHSIQAKSPIRSFRNNQQNSKNYRWDKGGFLSSTKHLWPQTSQYNTSTIDVDQASQMYLPAHLRENNHVYQKIKAQALEARLHQQKLKQPIKTPVSRDLHQDSIFTQRKITTDGDTYLAEKKSVKTTEGVTPAPETDQAPATERPTLQQVIDGDMGNKTIKFKKNVQAFPSLDADNDQSQGKQTLADMLLNKRHPNISVMESETSAPWKQKSIMKKKDPKRQSFSMCQTKYGDSHKLKHPLKEQKGPILNDESTIAKMKQAQRYPIPEKLLHRPLNFDLYIDSLMHAAYNSDENEEWANKKQDIDAPCNSIESIEQIDFYSSSSEELAPNLMEMASMDNLEEEKQVEQEKEKEEDAEKEGDEEKAKENADAAAAANAGQQSSMQLLVQDGSVSQGTLEQPALAVPGLQPALVPAPPKEIKKEEQKKIKIKKNTQFMSTSEQNKYQSKKAWEHHKKMQAIKVQQDALELHGFDLLMLRDYPHKVRDSDVPDFLLQDQKKKMDCFADVQDKIAKEFKEKQLLPTKDHVQSAYEHFCFRFKAPPLTVLQHFHDGVFSYRNYMLDMPQVKALSCTIPLIDGLKHLELINNNLSDEMTALIIMAAFMSPTIDSLTIGKNSVQRISSRTMRMLNVKCPSKLKKLDLDGSSDISHHLEYIISDIGNMQFIRSQPFRPCQELQELCLSNIPIAIASCRHICDILVNTTNLQHLDLQNCKISGSGMRFVLDGVNRNMGLRSINLSFNSLVSKIYEFAIKVAKILCSHDDMVHLDLTSTGLRPEEVIFIGMTLPMSKSCMGLHLSANRLGYYERIFLRTLIDAKVQYHFKNYAAKNFKSGSQDLKLKPQKRTESNQVMELSQNDYLQEQLQQFITAFNHIEKQKMNVNEQIQQVLKESDFVNIFRQIKQGEKPGSTSQEEQQGQQSKQAIQSLIEKINHRQLLIENQRKETEKYHDYNVDVQDPAVIADFRTMGLYTKADLPNPTQEDKRDVIVTSPRSSNKGDQDKERSEQDGLKRPSGAAGGPSRTSAAGLHTVSPHTTKEIEKTMDSHGNLDTRTAEEESVDPANDPLRQTDFSALYEDQFLLQNTLKIDRIRQRVQLDALKNLEGKSAAEIAMMFMGINKVAHDVLMDNPMTGYMSQVIFTRVLGQEDVEDGDVWRDCNQCWICQRWKKHQITFRHEDMNNMKQNIQRLYELDAVLQLSLDPKNDGQIMKVHPGKLKEMIAEQKEKEDGQNDGESHLGLPARADDNKHKSYSTRSQDRLCTESFVSDNEILQRMNMPSDVQFDPICPIPFDKFRAEKLLPSNHHKVQDIDLEDNAGAEDSSESSDDEFDRFIKRTMPHQPTERPARARTRTFRANMAVTKSSFGADRRQLDSQDSQEQPYNFKRKHYTEDTQENIIHYKYQIAKGLQGVMEQHHQHGPDQQMYGYGGHDEPPLNISSPRQAVYSNYKGQQTSTPRQQQQIKIQQTQLAKDATHTQSDKQHASLGDYINVKTGKTKKQKDKYINDDGVLVRMVKRKVMMNGVSYTLDEEVPVRPDESTSSPGTSEDEFDDQDHDGIVDQFQKRLMQKLKQRTKSEKKNAMKLQKMLEKNAPKTRSLFSRRQVHLCASFNDWVPQELKTLHELKLERKKGQDLQEYLEQEGKQALRSQQDELNVLQYSSTIPAGRHFFYFIFDRQYICLSASYPIARFKDTNVFLNELQVTARQERVESVKLKVSTLPDGSEEFLMGRSVFKTFQIEDEEMQDKMFKQDIKYSRITSMSNRAHVQQKIVDTVEKYYIKLKGMFNYQLAQSKHFPALSMEDVTKFCYKSKLFDKHMNMAALDKNLVATNASINGFKNPNDRELHRYEFLEFLLRTAKSKYCDPKIYHDVSDAFEHMMVKDISPYMPVLEGEPFRQKHVYNSLVNLVLARNQVVLRRLYEGTGTEAPPASKGEAQASQQQQAAPRPSSQLKLPLDPLNLEQDDSMLQSQLTVSINSVRQLCKRANLNIDDTRVNICYIESLQQRIDTMKDIGLVCQMKYVEFLLFICRLAHELYAGTKEGKEMPLYEKIENVLDPLLATVRLKKVFSYTAKLKEEKQKLKELEEDGKLR